MTNVRQAHRRQFVSITNKLAQNNSLTLKARGLMLYLLSLPDDWVIHINHLEKVLVEGRDAILSAFKELKEAKYVWHQKMGFKEGWTYWVFEEPVSAEKFKEFLRTNGFPNNWVSQQLGNPQLQKTKEKDTKNSSSTKATPPPNPEEEEELKRRLKERPKDSAKIASLKKWRETVLEDIRSDSQAKSVSSSVIEERKRRAENWDGKKVNGMHVVAAREYVEFSLGAFARQVRYDVSEEEWKEKTGWS